MTSGQASSAAWPDEEVALTAIASAALRQAPDFVALWDARLRACFLNAAGREMVGLSPGADIAAFEIPDFFPPERRLLIQTVGVPEMLREGRWEKELCLRHFADASRRTEVRWLAVALRGDAGRLIGAAAFAVDISGRRRDLKRAVGQSEATPSSIPDDVDAFDAQRRFAFEDQLRRNEARLRAVTELVGLGIYSWDPVTGALEWDNRLRAMWGLPPGAAVDTEVFEAGIHVDDLARVRLAIAACLDPGGDGRYDIEYRVIGRDDGVTRHIATSGRTFFKHGRGVDFIGAAIDVTAQRQTEAAVRASEAQFRSFAEHSSTLIWIADPAVGAITYRSAAFERIWGVPRAEAPTALAEWIKSVHPDDRRQVERALADIGAGEVAHFQYRIVRPVDGAVRWLRETSFPIRDERGAVTGIGGITEDVTQGDGRQVYIVSATAEEERRLANFARSAGYRTRSFATASAFLDIAPVLASGCVLVDLRKARQEGLSIPRELKARAIALPAIALDGPAADIMCAVVAMKAGAVDYLTMSDEATFRRTLESAIAECHGAVRPTTRDESAGARIARLTPREREVLVGLVEGGTNKSIAQDLGISPRTVELHRAQVMSRLGVSSLTELLQTALIAGLAPSPGLGRPQRKRA